jgi:uncharacterized protein
LVAVAFSRVAFVGAAPRVARYVAVMTSATVAVRGEATLMVEPEVAEFAATVTVRDMDRTVALQRLSSRVAAVRAALDERADVIERHDTSRLSTVAETNPSSRWSAEVMAYRGTATTTVVMVDLDAVGDVMMTLADVAEVSVEGPWWSVRPGSPVFRDARHAAIEDAIVRARDYAAALGAQVTGLVELSDMGMGHVGSRAVQVAAAAMAVEGTGPTIDLDPQRQRIDVAVEARFSISEPTVLRDPLD